ncbi:prepilin peptidase [Nguyenibacter sp. L1]|uniref:A24 family peptidase n=1 Tax=Nguyenibacter sp. L1 TaxID=3049350 RepID=UPI002B469C45|nr:prepilin peptidase [Nguyenibacter sp. L1]WRH88025.1 prepilin peptidase [Nguyenibacter sp. L1]
MEACLAQGVGAGFALLLLWAALRDIAVRLIPDWLVSLVALSSISLAIIRHHALAGLISGGILFCLGFACWSRGWMGGADVKLLGAVGLAIQPRQIPDLVLAVTLAGGVLAVLYLMARTFVAERGGGAIPRGRIARVLRIERWRLHRGCPLPYVCAIAVGSVIVLL